jgi:hypothetical protein
MNKLFRHSYALVLISLILLSCGYVYDAEIQGFIEDSETGQGINGASIYVFAKEPDAADDDGYITITSTTTTNNQQGYYRAAVLWSELFGEFGSEGDTKSLWIGVIHPDYESALIEAKGILSGTANTLSLIQLDRITFTAPWVGGRIVNASGEGVNGVRVVLDLDSTTDTEDYVANTTIIEGVPGSYRFQNVSWRDPANAGNSSDDEDAVVSVDDSQWQGASTANVTITSDQEITVSDSIQVSRVARTEFSVTLRGRILDRDGSNEYGISGVQIEIDKDNDGSADFYAQSGQDGSWSVQISWTDVESPNQDFDYEGGDTALDPGIPAGEDGLLVNISYLNLPADDGDAYSTAGADETAYRIFSWNAVNSTPDVVE